MSSLAHMRRYASSWAMGSSVALHACRPSWAARPLTNDEASTLYKMVKAEKARRVMVCARRAQRGEEIFR